MTIDDLVNSLRKGNIGPNEIEAIRIMKKIIFCTHLIIRG